MKSPYIPCASAKQWKGHVLGILFSQTGDERHVELSLPTLVGPSLGQSLRWPIYMRANDARFKPLCLSVLIFILLWFSAAQFSHSAISTSLWPHGLQHARPPCPSPIPGAYSDSFPLSWWCHPTISSSVIPFSSSLQSFAVSGSFQVSQFFASGGQSTGVSLSASVLPVNIQDSFPLGWTSWISLQSKGLSRVFSNTTVQKHRFFDAQRSL